MPTITTTDRQLFKNPYEGLPKTARISVDISIDDYMLVKTMRVTLGTVSGTLGTLWSKMCESLRRLGMTDHTKCEEFEDFIANCVVLPREEYDSLLNDATQYQQQRFANKEVKKKRI